MAKQETTNSTTPIPESPRKQIAISVKDLYITYKGMKSLSLRRTLMRLGKNKKETYEAIKGVSFDVYKGSVVGLIGQNGSGKSTLLRTLAGIYSPNKGKVDTFGQRVALLALGVGFQRNLSGRENIMLSGLLMGFTEKEIRAKIPEIIEFSELGDFIDKPVRTYSSGMVSKLGFSITSTLQADIILIDEVLSVGDVRFKKKSYKRVKELMADDSKTVVVVSHSTSTLEEICNHIVWINKGEFVMEGRPEEVLKKYDEFMKL